MTHGQQLALVRPQPVKPTAPGGMEIVISLLAIWQNIHSITMSGKELKEFLDLDIPEHLHILKDAYARFPQIGGRDLDA